MVELIAHGESCPKNGEKGDCCDVCGGRLISDFERGQYVCKECGIVPNYPMLSPECESRLSERSSIGTGFTTSLYDSGPPTTIAIHDLGISSEVGGGFRDAKGRALSGKARYRAILLRKWHSRTRTKNSKDLGIAKALTALNDLADRLDLPKYVREEACTIYRKVVEKRLTMGRSISVFVAVSLYAAIRIARLPLMLRDVLPILQVDLPEFNAYLNILKSEGEVKVPPPDPVAWVPKIASQCCYSQRSQLLAAEYIRAMTRTGETFGMLPHVVATIALYRMGGTNGEKKNLYAVARAAMCAPTSIQKGFVSESHANRNSVTREITEAGSDEGPRKELEMPLRQNSVIKEVSGGFSNPLYTAASEQSSKVKA